MKSSLKKGGEVKVLQDLLNSVKVDEKRDAIRKVNFLFVIVCMYI